MLLFTSQSRSFPAALTGALHCSSDAEPRRRKEEIMRYHPNPSVDHELARMVALRRRLGIAAVAAVIALFVGLGVFVALQDMRMASRTPAAGASPIP